MMDKIDNDQFINKLITAFPEITEEVLDEDYAGLITLQVGCFMRFTREAINNNDDKVYIKCFEFVSNMLDKVEFNIENSLTISWLGKLNFDNNKYAWSLLPLELQNRYVVLQNYYSAPPSQKVKDFLDNLTD